MRNESRKSGSGRGGEKPVAERRHGACRLLLHITYDIRELIGELTGPGEAPIPATNSQQKKWRKAIDTELPGSSFRRPRPGSCGSIGPSGRRPPPCMSSAARGSSMANAGAPLV